MTKQLCTLLLLTVIAAGALAQTPAVPHATFGSGHPTTTNNADSCDITAAPAATLLLPWFEVDVTSARSSAVWTVFTLTNVSPIPQIVRVTLWTDRAFPVVTFNVFLTGYDAQKIDMYDLLVNGIIPSTSSGSAAGRRSSSNTSNPNFATDASTACATTGGTITAALLTNIRSAFTTGSYPGVSGIGNAHTNAAGYVTADVVSTCSAADATTAAFFNELLFDNVLIGDYAFFNPDFTNGNYGLATTMVHLRAVPEGGAAGVAAVATNLPYTFYDRYTPTGSRAFDRRQPLPSTFAGRWITGGTATFNTEYLIWREGTIGPGAATADYASNAAIPVVDVVRFDERENATAFASSVPSMAAAARLSAAASAFPPNMTGDVAGWFYLNLNNGGAAAYGGGRTVSQNWVISRTIATGRYGSDMNVPALGNGCSAAPAAGGVIGPASN